MALVQSSPNDLTDPQPDWFVDIIDYCEALQLSERESQLLLLAVRGVVDKEAAGALGCSRHTVATYWKRIFAKVGQQSQRNVIAHMARWTLLRLADRRAACACHAEPDVTHCVQRVNVEARVGRDTPKGSEPWSRWPSRLPAY